MAADRDPRLHPYRTDIAAASLRGLVQAAKFVEPVVFQVRAPVLDLFADREATELASQLLFGEVFDVYEETGDFAWGQNRADGYVGFVRRSGLDLRHDMTHRVTALSAHIYDRPNFKCIPVLALPAGAQVCVTGQKGDFLQIEQGYLSKQHVSAAPLDFVSEAARYVGVPYLWGGRSSFGLDCSALVQLALMATGQACPRDSDMQMDALGSDTDDAYRRGDLLFWSGHVGIVFDDKTLLHANVHHMSVAFEGIQEAILRIAKKDGPVIGHKRIH